MTALTVGVVEAAQVQTVDYKSHKEKQHGEESCMASFTFRSFGPMACAWYSSCPAE